MEYILLTSAASASIAVIATYIITKYLEKKKITELLTKENNSINLRLEREFEKGKEIGHSDERKNSTKNDLVELKLQSEFQKGKEAGKLEELSNFTLTYEPFFEITEEYMGLKKRSTLGYHMQLFYAGFPIGHQTRYVTHNQIEYDKERIEKLLNSEVASAINTVIQLAATKGMKAKSLPRKEKVPN